MKQIKQFLLVVALFTVFANVGWGQLLNENFSYTLGTALTANGWTAHSGGTTNLIIVGASTITYPGYLSSGTGLETSLATSGQDVNKTFTQQTSGTVYASCLVNITSATTTGDYFFHLGASTIGSDYHGKVYIKKDASGNLAFGISKIGAVADAVFTPFSYAAGTTYLLVLRYTIVSGATNDYASIYINPTLNAVEPVTGWITSTDTPADLASIGSVGLRQGSSTAPALKLDGIRVATTWADIVGPVFVAPTTQAYNISFSSVQSNQMTVNWKNAIAARKALSFKGKDCDENCLENRIRNIRSFIGAEISKTCGEYKIISSFIKKIAPVYEKANPALPKGSGKSPSEKSFVALNGYGTQSSELINNLGASYDPQNTFIVAATFETFVNDMIGRAKSIAKLEGLYADAVKARYEIYHGTNGLIERQDTIKEYLASFTGGKKNQMYIEYDRLIKGR